PPAGQRRPARRSHLRDPGRIRGRSAGRTGRRRECPGGDAVTAPSFEEFLSLSVDLTAFEETTLLGTGLARPYLATVRAACGDEVVTALLDAYRAARAHAAVDARDHDRTLPDPALLDRALLDRALRHRIFSDDRLGPVARN